MKLVKGGYLGYRRGSNTWHARYRDRKNMQHYIALDDIPADDYEDAKAAAESWFVKLGGSAVRSVKRDTVRQALETYIADLRRHKRPDTAKEAEGRFKRTIFGDRIGKRPLESATRDDFEEWRDRLTTGREPRSVNREVRSVIAGLNRATQLGHVGNPAAWRLKPLSDDVDDDGETAIFLDPGQRAAIIGKAGEEEAAFFRGLELTGARPKELAAASVKDYDGKSLRLAHRKGRPPKLRVRYTVLGADAIEFFERRATGKEPNAPLFTEDGEQPWRRHLWCRRMRSAIEAINKDDAEGSVRIPQGASAYCFRHARISELLQIYGVDPLTVAQQTGTSLAMIEKAYMRFIPHAMREKLAGLKEA